MIAAIVVVAWVVSSAVVLMSAWNSVGRTAAQRGITPTFTEHLTLALTAAGTAIIALSVVAFALAALGELLVARSGRGK